MAFKTYQEAFDFVCDKLAVQGARCVDAVGICSYSDGRGNHCAVGHALPEEDDRIMRFKGGVEALVVAFPKAKEYLQIGDQEFDQVLSFWGYVQTVHDTNHSCFFSEAVGVLVDQFKIDVSKLRKIDFFLCFESIIISNLLD